MLHTSYIEIDKKALVNNFSFIKKRMGPNVKISSVVKGNAYGHGIETFVPLAEMCGINHFSVFNTDEAYRVKSIRHADSEIMIMGMIDTPEIKWAVELGVEFYVFEHGRLEEAAEAAKRFGKKAKVHIELETGMNRTGFEDHTLKNTIDYLKKNARYFDIKGICTHYAGAESIGNYVRIKSQIRKYNNMLKQFLNEGIVPAYRHTACSAASMRYPQTIMDMVRIGILQYGFWPNKETFIDYLSGKEEKTDPLKRVISWKSKIMDTKEVKTGEFIGYGTSFLAHKDMRIASIPVGYSHGYSRSLSNLGRVLVREKRVSVIGVVNMNMMTIDITDLPEAEKGDEVVLIGTQGDLEISVASFSEMSDQLNYEALTRLPAETPRVIT